MAAAPLGRQSAGDLRAGNRILVFYGGDVVWHVRYLLSNVDRDSWVMVTPDADIYMQKKYPMETQIETDGAYGL